VNRLPRTLANIEDARQLVRASGSFAANFLEAQEGVSRKDFFYRIKVCRKESRGSHPWLRLHESGSDSEVTTECAGLSKEADELTRILSPIAGKKAVNLELDPATWSPVTCHLYEKHDRLRTGGGGARWVFAHDPGQLG
jgi:four helix bundle protein